MKTIFIDDIVVEIIPTAFFVFERGSRLLLYCNCLIVIFETLNLAGPRTGIIFYSRFTDIYNIQYKNLLIY